jgi:hypothetical protein
MSIRAYLVLVCISVVLILPCTQAVAKTSWPELVNTSGSFACSAVKTDRPDVTVQVINYGDMYTADYVATRVRIFLSQYGRVAKTPTIG